ncbi:hypothetical protein B0H21DRAFT_711461 [Amylocystis lapponica]|nr:hypothetical protein B0H21DRAFT_711461 [Amylocystis lapponica]
MNDDDVISIASDESDNEQFVDRRAILQPAVQSVVDAVGGVESGAYRLEDEHTVARIFWETRVLPNDLVPILLETAGEGLVEDRCAIACADLMAAMTWPIDLAEEHKELDEDADPDSAIASGSGPCTASTRRSVSCTVASDSGPHARASSLLATTPAVRANSAALPPR